MAKKNLSRAQDCDRCSHAKAGRINLYPPCATVWVDYSLQYRYELRVWETQQQRLKNENMLIIKSILTVRQRRVLSTNCIL